MLSTPVFTGVPRNEIFGFNPHPPKKDSEKLIFASLLVTLEGRTPVLFVSNFLILNRKYR
jgi:hypothetical protein